MLGSYPRIQEESFHVLLTLESRDAGYVQRALDSLLARLPDDAVHRWSDGPDTRRSAARWLAFGHPAWMLVSLGSCLLALRSACAARARLARAARRRAARARHLRVAKTAVVLALVGSVLGPLSVALLRDWTPMSSFHSLLGGIAAVLFAGAASRAAARARRQRGATRMRCSAVPRFDRARGGDRGLRCFLDRRERRVGKTRNSKLSVLVWCSRAGFAHRPRLERQREPRQRGAPHLAAARSTVSPSACPEPEAA